MAFENQETPSTSVKTESGVSTKDGSSIKDVSDGLGILGQIQFEHEFGDALAAAVSSEVSKVDHSRRTKELESIEKSERSINRDIKDIRSLFTDYSVTTKLYEKARIAGEHRSFESKCVQIDVHGYEEVPREGAEDENIKPEASVSVQDMRRGELARKIIRNQLRKDLNYKPIKKEVKREFVEELKPFIKEEKRDFETSPVFMTPTSSFTNYFSPNYTSPNYFTPNYSSANYPPTNYPPTNYPPFGISLSNPSDVTSNIDPIGNGALDESDLQIIKDLSSDTINLLRGILVKKEQPN